MRVVVPEMHAAPGLPSQSKDGRPFPVQPENHRVVPDENMHLQATLAPHQVIEELAQFGRLAGALAPGQRRAAVEIPARDQDGMLRLARRLGERSEIGVAIHYEGSPIRVLDTPAITSRLKQLRIGHEAHRYGVSGKRSQ